MDAEIFCTCGEVLDVEDYKFDGGTDVLTVKPCAHCCDQDSPQKELGTASTNGKAVFIHHNMKVEMPQILRDSGWVSVDGDGDIWAIAPTTPSGDLVSREAVLYMLRGLAEQPTREMLDDVMEEMPSLVRALPSVLSVEKVGRRLEVAGVRLDICAYRWIDGDEMAASSLREMFRSWRHTGRVCNPKHGPPLPEALAALLAEVEK